MEGAIKNDPATNHNFERILHVVNAQMCKLHPKIRRIRRWHKLEMNGYSEPIQNYISSLKTAMEEARM